METGAQAKAARGPKAVIRRELGPIATPATRTAADGWREAWRIPARTPAGEAVFVVVRDRDSDPWRILSLDRPGA